jgi:putative spermidine/putrescine transport system substrate-binding protein
MVHPSNEDDFVAEEAKLSEASALTRRSLIARAGAAGAAMSFAGVLNACGDGSSGSGGSSGSAGSKTVVYADSGGTTRDASRIAFYDPFEKATGIRVVPADADPVRFVLMAERRRSEWDGIDAGAVDTIEFNRRGLLQQYPAGTSESDLVEEELRRLNTGVFFPTMNVVYRPEAFRGAKPSTWADFWDVRKFPGRRAVRKSPNWLIEAALLADGVPADQVQPLDFDRGFAKLDELRPHLTMLDTSTEIQQLFQNGDIELAQLVYGRAYTLQEQGVNVAVSWEQALQYGWGGPLMPYGTPHREAMVELAAFMTKAERQAEFAKLTGYGPTNSAALEFLDDRTLNRITTSPEHMKAGFKYNYATSADQRAEYTERMTKWLANG